MRNGWRCTLGIRLASTARTCTLVARVTWVASVLAVTACTSLPPAQTELTSTGYWQGRFSVTLTLPEGADTEESNDERASGKFRLRRTAARLELDLLSPFGQTLANAVSDNSGATLTTSKGQRFEAADTDSLVEQALGWRLPVDALPDWLSGKGLPGDDSWVNRNGWRVRVDQRLPSGKPRRLAARWPLEPRVTERRLQLFVVVDNKPASNSR